MNIETLKITVTNIIKNKKQWYLIPIALLILLLVLIVEFTTWASVFDYLPPQDSRKKITIRIIVYILILLIVFLFINIKLTSVGE